MRKALFLILFVLGIVMIAGCARQAPQQEIQQEETQLANPASQYCIDMGGKLEIKDEENGQVGYCTLSDGTVCEEWAYLRDECPPPR